MSEALGARSSVEMSVIIAVRDDAEGLRVTLTALADQDFGEGRFEVIVVDDASTDGTSDVAHEFAFVRLIQRATSGGSYVARNEGLRAALGSGVAITDADCRPDPQWLSAGWKSLQRNPESVFAGLIKMPLDAGPSLAAMVDVMRHLDQERYVQGGSAATANLFATAATFRDVGPFDERLRSSGDAEWSRRAVRAGHELIFEPDAVVLHPPRTTARALLRKARRVGEGSRAASRARIMESKPLYLTPWCVVPYGLERGRQRLRDNGADPRGVTWVALAFAQVALVQLPQAVYALRADARAWLKPDMSEAAARPASRPAGRSRILVTNCVIQNGGDAAILHALMGSIRTHLGIDTEFVVIDDHPEAAARLMPDLDVRPRVDRTFEPPRFLRRFEPAVSRVRRLRVLAAGWLIGRGLDSAARLLVGSRQLAALAQFRDADAVVSTGGTYLVERYQIGGRLLELEVALVMRRPLILFTQSVGRFVDPRNRSAVRRVLSRARLVLVRDQRSLSHLLDLGLSGRNVRVAADGVFGLSLTPPKPSAKVRRIAISVRDWPYAAHADDANAAYQRAIGQLAVQLVKAVGAEVVFVSTCQGVPDYWMDDSAVALKIVEALGEDGRQSITVDRDSRTPTELVKYLNGFDLVVATRMHMAILALVAGAPVFPIAYEFKTRELFDRLGLGEWVYDFEAVSEPDFVSDVERFIAGLPSLSDGLWKAVHGEHESATLAAALMAKALRLQASPTTRLRRD
jgi:colanic acid/amylovoran biosynthesis protein